MSATHRNVVNGRYIVTYRPGANRNVMEAHKSAIAAENSRNPNFEGTIHKEFAIAELRGYSATFNEATKAHVELMNEVAAVEPVQLYRHCEVQKNSPWGLSRIGTRAKLNARGPYSYQYSDSATGEGVVAYVMDTGINVDHVEFQGRATRGKKFVTDHPGASTSEEDVEGHGTHCAGIIASRAYGVAKKVEVIGVKVFNDLKPANPNSGASTDDIIRAIEWVYEDVRRRKGPAVVNMSFGGGYSRALNSAVAELVRSGVVVCAAAGNNGTTDLGSPASEILAITVGALTINDETAQWSSFGKYVDIVAPGEDIESCWIGSKDAKQILSGTSMATPHVSGVACCLLSDKALGEKDPHQIFTQILTQADKNKIGGLNGERSRNINAILQVADN